VSHKFGTPLPAERIALEGPSEGTRGAIPVRDEAGDPSGHGTEGPETGALETLAFEDAEPELDLVEPRGMQRQEFQPDPPLLAGQPGRDIPMRVNREVVDDHDEAPPGPAASEHLEELEELLVPAPPPDQPPDLPAADIQAREDGHGPVPPIGLLDPDRSAGAQRPGWVQVLQDLPLALLVDAEHPGAARGVEVQPHDSVDLPPELGIRRMEPTADPVRFEVGLAQPSVDRALADGVDEAPRSACGLQAMARRSWRSPGGKAGWAPRSACIHEPVQPIPGEAVAPLAHPVRGPAHGPGDGLGAVPPSGEQDTAGPRGQPCAGPPGATQVLQDPPLARSQSDCGLGFRPSPISLE